MVYKILSFALLLGGICFIPQVEATNEPGSVKLGQSIGGTNKDAAPQGYEWDDPDTDIPATKRIYIED